jgi:glycosyltransferase involved in cell wall biosynthesis
LQRRAPDIPAARIENLTTFFLNPRLRRRSGELPTDYWARRNEAFCRAVRARGFGRADAVYAFNGAALEIFAEAKKRGLRTILDQTAAPWRWNSSLLREEQARWPGWEAQPAEIDDSGALTHREEAEWRLADAIVVGSEFARRAMIEMKAPAHRIAVVPYPPPEGFAVGPREPRPERFTHERKLRVLFVGALQLRKGIQYLYEAARGLQGEPVEFRAVGPSALSAEAVQELCQYVEVVGVVPRDEVWREYAWADVFALPTLSEGSANVCYEALSAGLPVVTTERAGVPEELFADRVRLAETRNGGELALALRYFIAPPRRLAMTSATEASSERRVEYSRKIEHLVEMGQ